MCSNGSENGQGHSEGGQDCTEDLHARLIDSWACGLHGRWLVWLQENGYGGSEDGQGCLEDGYRMARKISYGGWEAGYGGSEVAQGGLDDRKVACIEDAYRGSEDEYGGSVQMSRIIIMVRMARLEWLKDAQKIAQPWLGRWVKAVVQFNHIRSDLRPGVPFDLRSTT